MKDIAFSNLNYGEFIGLDCILLGKYCYDYSAQCINDVKLYYISKDAFLLILKENNTLLDVLNKRILNK